MARSLKSSSRDPTGEGAPRGRSLQQPRSAGCLCLNFLALAAIETFVNLEPNLQPNDLVSIEGDIPDELEIGRLDPKGLSVHWYETRDESLRRFGDEWIRAGHGTALLVPSAAIRGEWNIRLNPAHPDFSKIRFQDPQPFEFDARMFR